MKKKVLAVLLSAVMVIGLAACGGNGNSASSNTADNAEGGKDKLKIALVVNQKFGDKASMDDLAAGADKATADFGVEIKKLESAEASKYEEDIRAMADAGYEALLLPMAGSPSDTDCFLRCPDSIYTNLSSCSYFYSLFKISWHKEYALIIILGIWKGPLKRLPLAGCATVPSL